LILVHCLIKYIIVNHQNENPSPIFFDVSRTASEFLWWKLPIRQLSLMLLRHKQKHARYRNMVRQT
jgi:hypothetical protein